MGSKSGRGFMAEMVKLKLPFLLPPEACCLSFTSLWMLCFPAWSPDTWHLHLHSCLWFPLILPTSSRHILRWVLTQFPPLLWNVWFTPRMQMGRSTAEFVYWLSSWRSLRAPWEMFGSLQRHFGLSTLEGVGEVRVLLACNGQRPGMQLHVLQCTGQPNNKELFDPKCQQCPSWETPVWASPLFPVGQHLRPSLWYFVQIPGEPSLKVALWARQPAFCHRYFPLLRVPELERITRPFSPPCTWLT